MILKAQVQLFVDDVCSVIGVEGIVVDQNQALRFALDVARGMEFLHSMEPLIPNLTLNSKHIMVTRQRNSVFINNVLSDTVSVGIISILRCFITVGWTTGRSGRYSGL